MASSEAAGLHARRGRGRWARAGGVALISLACGACGGAQGPTAHAGAISEERGVAEGSTWLTLAERGVRMQAPRGWSWTRRGDRFVAAPSDGKAAMVLAGADDRAALAEVVRAIGREYGVDGVELGKGRRAELRDIPAVIYEDEAATSAGTAADVLVLVGDAPSGRGVVVLFVMAWDETQLHDPIIIDAANSLRPI